MMLAHLYNVQVAIHMSSCYIDRDTGIQLALIKSVQMAMWNITDDRPSGALRFQWTMPM